MSQLIYLNHSGFLLELEKAVLVFDYFTDPAAVLSQYEGSGKTFCFFVSHAHYDHWNSDIFDFFPEGRRFFFLEDGCELPEKTPYNSREDDMIFQVAPDFAVSGHEAMEQAGILSIRCFGSTDEGVSFLVETAEGTVFHSGDLNFWDWEAPGKVDVEMEAAYRSVLEHVADVLGGKTLWLTMLPVDQRLGSKAFAGALVFLDCLRTKYFVPDHLNGGVDLPKKLAEKLQGSDTEVLALTTPGQRAYVG